MENLAQWSRLWSDKWADVPGQWSFIGLEWVLRSPDIQWMVVLHYTHRRRLVHRSAQVVVLRR